MADVSGSFASLGEGRFVFTVDDKQYTEGMKRAQDTSEKTTKQMGEHATGVNNLFKQLSSTVSTDLVEGFAELGVAALSLEKIIDTTKEFVAVMREGAQVEVSLTALYKENAEEFVALSEKMRASTLGTTEDVKKSAIEFNNLAKTYGFSNDKIKQLIALSSEYSTVFGKTMEDTSARIDLAMRGMGRSAGELGIILNDKYLKTMGVMTEEQRQNFDSLDEVTKGQIRFNTLMRDSADIQGKSAEQTGAAGDQMSILNRNMQELQITLAEKLYPTMNAGLKPIADLTSGMVELVKSVDDAPDSLEKMGVALEDLGTNTLKFAGPLAQSVALMGKMIDLVGQGIASIEKLQGTDVGGQGGGGFATTEQSAANDEAAKTQREAAARDENIRQLKEAQDQISEVAKQHIADLNAEDKAEEVFYERSKHNAEVVKDSRLEYAKEEHDGRIKYLEQESTAINDALDDQLQAADDAKKATIAAADETRDKIIEDIRLQKQASDIYWADQIAHSEQARDNELQAATDVRDANLRKLEAEQESLRVARNSIDANRAQTRAQEDEDARNTQANDLHSREVTQRGIEEGYAARKKGIEDSRDAELLSIEHVQQKYKDDTADRVHLFETTESERLRKARESIDKEHDARDKAEQDRHDATIKHLDDETNAALAGIQKQVDALNRAGQQQDVRNREGGYNAQLQAAQKDVQTAEGPGHTQAEREAAEKKLSQLVTTENQARIKTRRDAQLQELNNQKSALAEQAATQKQAADNALKQEGEANDAHKKIEQDALDATERGQKEVLYQITRTAILRDEQFKAQQEEARNGAKTQIDALDRVAQKEKDNYADTIYRVKYTYQLQDFTRAQNRKQEDADIAATRLAQDTELKHYGEAQQLTYEAAQRRIHKYYDDPVDGVIAKQHRAQTDASNSFEQQAIDANKAYDEINKSETKTYDQLQEDIGLAKRNEKERIDDARTQADTQYTELQKHIIESFGTGDANGTGLLDKIERAHKDAKSSTDLQILAWNTWKDALIGPEGSITKASQGIDAFNEKVLAGVTNVQTLINAIQAPGGGNAGVNVTPGQDLTEQEFGAALAKSFQEQGMVDLIAASCGPIIVAGIAKAAGQDVSATDVAKFGKGQVLANGQPNLTAAAGTADIFALASQYGITLNTTDRAGASAQLQSGNLVAVNLHPNASTGFPGHFLLAQGINAQGQYYFGHTGTALKAGHEWMTMDEAMRASGASSATYYTVSGKSGPIKQPGMATAAAGASSGDTGGPQIGDTVDLSNVPSSLKSFTVNDSGPEVDQVVRYILDKTQEGMFIKAGLEKAHAPADWADEFVYIAAQESGGGVLGQYSATIVNPNAVPGTNEHATGMMQTLPSTFEDNKIGVNDSITNPVDNVAAAANYIMRAYGSKGKTGDVHDIPYYQGGSRFKLKYPEGGSVGGYAEGGPIPFPTLLVGLHNMRAYAVAGESGPERVVPGADGAGGVQFILQVAGNIYGDMAMKQAVKDTVNEETRTGGIRVGRR